MARDWGKVRWVRCGGGVPTTQSTLQGSNGTFLLSLEGPNAQAFSVSPERAAGSAEVQVLVRAPSLVDYEKQPVMLVKVRGALGHRGAQAVGRCGPHAAASSPVLRSWPLTPSAGTPRSPW